MSNQYTTPDVNDRFWSKVNKDGSIPQHCPELGNCWEWTAAIYKKGLKYGLFRYSGNMTVAHRISWILTNGDIPNELCVLHKCDNPKCVNPAHLFLGTYLDNNRDRENKGRGNQPSGESSGRCILSDLQVVEIRSKYKQGGFTHRSLAREYHVHKSQITRILNNKTRVRLCQ